LTLKETVDNWVSFLDNLSKIFDEEILIESFMDYYKDFDYVKYVFNLDFEKSYKLVLKCNEKTKDKKMWEYFLSIKSAGYEKGYDEFVKENTLAYEAETMTKEQKETEEQRLINKYSNMDTSKFKKRKII
jgi:hypothetical protein